MSFAGSGVPRRRALRLIAAGAATLLTPAARSETIHVRWRGITMGAEAALTVRHADTARARDALRDCVALIRRLETVFDLYRPDSALARLNATGALSDPPTDLVTVLRIAEEVSRLSDGAFDVTVQPLWKVHVAAARAGRDDPEAIAAARARVDWRRLSIAADRIAFTAPGMAATLNGIAQGYVTDSIVERLCTHGFNHVLADAGEVRALGQRSTDEAWRIGVDHTGRPSPVTTLRLADRAAATSSPGTTPIGPDPRRHHLFDPSIGRSAHSWAGVTVVANTAVRADALSTAIAVAPPDAAQAILTAGRGEEVILTDDRQRIVRLQG